MVGVIANLALYFATNTLFARTITIDAGPLAMHLPDLATRRWAPLVIVAIATALIFALRWPVLRVLDISATLGLLAGALGVPVN